MQFTKGTTILLAGTKRGGQAVSSVTAATIR